MANYAKPLPLRDGDRATLESMTRGNDVSASLALRARTVLLAADGVPNIGIVEVTGFSEPTVRRWRTRYEESGIDGLGGRAPPRQAAENRRSGHHCRHSGQRRGTPGRAGDLPLVSQDHGRTP